MQFDHVCYCHRWRNFKAHRGASPYCNDMNGATNMSQGHSCEQFLQQNPCTCSTKFNAKQMGQLRLAESRQLGQLDVDMHCTKIFDKTQKTTHIFSQNVRSEIHVCFCLGLRYFLFFNPARNKTAQPPLKINMSMDTKPSTKKTKTCKKYVDRHLAIDKKQH